MTTTNLSKSLPTSLIRRLRWNRMTRRLVSRWAQNRNVRITTGVAAGLRFNAAASNPAYALGTNELPVQKLLAQHLSHGDVFYDIGANVGFFTIIGANLVGPAGRVYAFEPVPENARSVDYNASLNDFRQVTVLRKAVSDEDGSGELLLARYSGGSALATVNTPPPDLKKVISVEVITIDTLIGRLEISPPNVIKIDVEGAEISVLRGMSRTLADFRPLIIYEIDDENEDSFIHKQEVCAAFLRDSGYEITQIEDSYQEIDWLVGHFIATPASQ